MDLTMIIFSLNFVKILKISSWTIHDFKDLISGWKYAGHSQEAIIKSKYNRK